MKATFDRSGTELELLEAHHLEVRRLLEKAPALLAERVEAVSGWSPLEHAIHLALVNEAILGNVEKLLRGEAAPDPVPGPTWAGRLILWTGWVPRGRAKSPRSMVPPEGMGPGDALAVLARAEARLEAVLARRDAIRAARGRIRHYIFGGLTAAQWIRTARLHTRHHLRIIADIERVRSRLHAPRGAADPRSGPE
jgi:hypothetical protein